MIKRDVFLKEFRGQTIGTVTQQSTLDELFQNEVLRPILKLQNDLLIASFLNYIITNKIDFGSFSVAKKFEILENILQKDIKYKNVLKGMIVGLFTTDEYAQYLKNAASLNKRMMVMLIERLKSQIQLF